MADRTLAGVNQALIDRMISSAVQRALSSNQSGRAQSSAGQVEDLTRAIKLLDLRFKEPVAKHTEQITNLYKLVINQSSLVRRLTARLDSLERKQK